MGYLKQVWNTNKALAWLMLLNIALISILSIGFTKHFPEVVGAWDGFYQLGLIPSIWGLYALLGLLVFLPLSFIPYAHWPLQVLSLTLAGNLAVVVFIDGYIYDIYSYHINWFFIEAFWADEGGEFFDISYKTYFLFSFVATLIALCQFFFLWLVNKKLLNRTKLKFAGVVLFAFVLANVLFVNLSHIKAFNENYSPITSLSGYVPFYFPMQSRSMGDGTGSPQTANYNTNSNIQYPKHPMQCKPLTDKPNILMVVLESWRADTMDAEVSPNTYQLAQESLVFNDHHSNGSVTTRGIFSLMYGLVPTYMDNFVANNGVGGPVLLQELVKEGYDFGVYPSGDIDRLKLTDTSFLPIREYVEHGEGKDTIEKDIDVLSKMVNKLESSDNSVFGFMFFNSTHYLYYYPEAYGKFQPSQKPSLLDFKAGKDPEPYINRYKNSIYFIDDLIGQLIQHLKAINEYDNTILIVTSDHAEEFADTKPTRYGHGSNYTNYQTQVPLVIHWPGKSPQVFDNRTSSIDIMATLVDEVLDCENPIADYSNGLSLFDGTERDVQIMASYYNYAFVTPYASYIQNPIGLPESRDNDDKLIDSSLKPKKAFNALQQMKHFYESNAAQ